MKRITEEIDNILMGNFDFRPRFNPPRNEYRPNKLPSQVDHQEGRVDEQEKSTKGDETERSPNEEEEQEEKPQDQSDKDDRRQQGQDTGEKHEDVLPKKDEEEELTTKNGEEQKDGASVEQQGETPPGEEEHETGRQGDGGENDSTTAKGTGKSGDDTPEGSDKNADDDSAGVHEDPRKIRGSVRFQAVNVRDDGLPKKKTKKMKCIPVSEENEETLAEDTGKKNGKEKEVKNKATDGRSKERVQETDNQTENPETNEVTTVKQDEESDKRKEVESKIQKDPDDSEIKEEESPDVEQDTKRDEEPERKNDEGVKSEESPEHENEEAERKEEKSNIQNGASRDDESRKEKKISNTEKVPRKMEVRPEEKDEYYNEEYKRNGGHDYKDFQSHRHKESDKQQHKHHNREEGEHDHRREHEQTDGTQDQGSKLKAANKDSSDDLEQRHLGRKQKQLHNKEDVKKGNHGQQYRISNKEQNNFNDGEENKYELNTGTLSERHLGSNSLDKIPVIEIFQGVTDVDYSKHSDRFEQSSRVPSTTHETPYISSLHLSTTPNPNQIHVESNQQSSIKGHFSLTPSPYQQRYELPNLTPHEGLLSTAPNHFSITSSINPMTIAQEHIITTTPSQLLTLPTPNQLTTTPHDNLLTTTPSHLVLTSDPLHITTFPQNQLFTTIPTHVPLISTSHEVSHVSPQEDRIAISNQLPQTKALEHERISTTTAPRQIIDQLDKQKSLQHNELLKYQQDADHHLKKQRKQLNEVLKGLNPENSMSPETSATDKRNEQQLDWQDYQQQLYYPKPSPKPQGFPAFITVETEKRRPPILVEDVDYRELVDIRDQRAVYDDQYFEQNRPLRMYYV